MSSELIAKIISSVGLSLDLVGAWLIAYEVVNQYKGNKFGRPRYSNPSDNNLFPPTENPAYKTWESIKYKKMWAGLLLLTVGFIAQIASNWVYLVAINIDAANNPAEMHSPVIPTKTVQPLPKTPPAITVAPKTTNPAPDK